MIKVLMEDFAPSQGKFSYVHESIDARIGRRNFVSSIRIVRLRESSFYNRVLDYDDSRRVEWQDSILTINAPNIFSADKREIKAGSNAFFPAESIIVAINVKHNDLDGVVPSSILRFAQDGAYSVVKAHSSVLRVQRENNDIIFDGKKFYGEEVGCYDDCYSITGIVTCYYFKYADLFARLVGHGVREITGICDEIPGLTPDVIANALYQRATAVVGGMA